MGVGTWNCDCVLSDLLVCCLVSGHLGGQTLIIDWCLQGTVLEC